MVSTIYLYGIYILYYRIYPGEVTSGGIKKTFENYSYLKKIELFAFSKPHLLILTKIKIIFLYFIKSIYLKSEEETILMTY